MDKPNLSIIVRDDDLPVSAIITGISRALSPSFSVECGRTGPDPLNARQGIKIDCRIVPVEAAPQHAGSDEEERIRAHCDLLDARGIHNGTKAIAIALHAYWTDDHRKLFGNYANPATVKRWRSQRRLAPAPYGPIRRRHQDAGGRIQRGLRRHHAIRACAAGITMKEGYAQALRDVETVNSGCYPLYERPGYPLVRFSYETFRRDCWKIRRHGGRSTRGG
jgi:hypothetical protein